MPLKESEAVVLRTYPMREADLLVTLFTRTEGKIKGVARSAKKSKKRFGGALEPLTVVRVYWEQRERHELNRIDSCEVLESPLSSTVDYSRAVALASANAWPMPTAWLPWPGKMNARMIGSSKGKRAG